MARPYLGDNSIQFNQLTCAGKLAASAFTLTTPGMPTFPPRMRPSIETLMDIGFLQSYTIIKDMVHVKRAYIPRQLSA